MWIFKSPTDETVAFRMAPGVIKTFGRAPRADFIIDAALVSRLHCRVEASDDSVNVIDLASTNGTYVNDKRISHATVTSGDRLRIGRVELSVEKA